MYLILLPLLVWGLLRGEFTTAAIVVVLLSKWRMFAVKPRYWLANIRANLVDIIVGLSIVAYMANSENFTTSVIWAGIYAVWLTLIKPRSSSFWVGAQAFIALGLGFSAMFNNFSEWHQVFLAMGSWLIAMSSARHFLNIFEDDYARSASHLWAVFAAELSLIFGHWHYVYGGFLPQVALVIMIIGYSLGLGFYLHKTRGLTSSLRNQLTAVCVITLLMIIILGNWQPANF